MYPKSRRFEYYILEKPSSKLIFDAADGIAPSPVIWILKGTSRIVSGIIIRQRVRFVLDIGISFSRGSATIRAGPNKAIF